MIGVGLVGKEVVHQLLALKHFSIHSLSNSKYTATATNATASLLDLLPASSAPLPAATAGATVELADHRKLIAALAQLVQENKKVILVDCTSDLAVTELYPTALAHGISVVTPNKKGFSSSQALYDSILAAQAAPSSGLCYLEATVGAGLPIICTLKDLLSTGDKIIKIEGVLSGTLSYIFNEFSTPAGSKVKFSEVVKIAKELGYTVSLRLCPLHLQVLTLDGAGAAPCRRPFRLGRRSQAHHPLPTPRLAHPPRLARGLCLAPYRHPHPRRAREHCNGRGVCEASPRV